jgi:hypothetical protein
VEVTHPIGEATSNGFLQLAVNASCLLFIAMGLVGDPPLLNRQPLALLWGMPAASWACFVLVLYVKAEKRRLKLDMAGGDDKATTRLLEDEEPINA